MKFIGFVAVAILLPACGEAPPAEPPAQPTPAAFALEPLTGADIEGQLGGELGCSFTDGERVLLLAMGNVDAGARSEALAKSGGATARLSARVLGGYDAMVEGATFSDASLTVDVHVDERNETGTEQVAYAAQLTARSGGGGDAAYDGIWTCGP